MLGPLLSQVATMKSLQHIRTRRQLFRAMAVGGASTPLLALAIKSASAGGNNNNQGGNNNQG